MQTYDSFPQVITSLPQAFFSRKCFFSAPAEFLQRSVLLSFPESADENRSLFKCADTALYSVKHLGGDGFCIYENDQEEN